MSELINPFVDFETQEKTIPKFRRDVTLYTRISKEAHNTLLSLAKLLTPNGTITDLLEYIGLHVYSIQDIRNLVDSETGFSTDELRQVGYEDGFTGNTDEFIRLYFDLDTNPFKTAYLRGFLEGNYVRVTTYE